MVSISGKLPVFWRYTHKYLRSLIVDLAVFYFLQISPDIVFLNLLETLFS